MGEFAPVRVKTAFADLVIPFSTGTGNMGKVANETLEWPHFIQRFDNPTRSKESLKRFVSFDPDRQRDLKNIDGYWLGGHSTDGRRARASIVERSVITLDLEGPDFTPAMFAPLTCGLSDIDDFEFFFHTSRKHTDRSPRGRLVVPLAQPVPVEDYEPLARLFAARIDPTLNALDPSCFRPAQMMFWPTLSADSKYVAHHSRGGLCDPDDILSEWRAGGADWSALPYSEKHQKARRTAKKAEDPREKSGYIGAFCRTYTVEDAILAFDLPYSDPTDNGPETRYTFTEGTGSNGAVVYDDGLFIYSHHSQDPAGGRLLNAFDLVRLHRFAHLDKETGEDESPTTLPSYKALIELVRKDDAVKKEIAGGGDLLDEFEDLGDAPQASKAATSQQAVPRPLEPRLHECVDPKTLPRRQFLYGTTLARGNVSVLVAPGGVGKSSLLVAEALAMVTGRELFEGDRPHAVLRVWYVNLEDPQDELDRRFAAGRMHYRIHEDDIGGRLFVNGRDSEIVIAKEVGRGFKICDPMVEVLEAALRKHAIDVLIVDPFVSSHRVSENDNARIDAIAKTWSRIADECGCAILLAHHARKPGMGQADLTANDARGASALLDASRSARVINRMSPKMAKEFGLEHPWRYLRVDDAKANLSPPTELAKWRRLATVRIGNRSEFDQEDDDSVGVAVDWSPPEASETFFSEVDEARMLASLSASTTAWRNDPQARDWIGRGIADELGLNLKEAKDRKAIRILIKRLIEEGRLVVVSRKDEQSKERQYVMVRPLRPGEELI